MKKFFKVAGIILGILIILHIILNITFSIQLRNKINELKKQGKPTTIAEIIPPPVPDEDNAAILYNKAFELMKNGEESNVKKLSTVEKYLKSLYDISQWTDEQKQEIPRLINSKEIQNIYRLLEEGSKKSKCRFNIEYEKGPEKIFFPYSFETQFSVKLLCIKALLEAESGNMEQAFNILLIGLKMSNHLKDEPTLISQLVRISGNTIIIKCIENISNSKSVPPQQTTLIMSGLPNHADITSLIKCLDVERVACGMWGFEQILQGKISSKEWNVWDNEPLWIRFYPTYLFRPIQKKDFTCYLTAISKMQENFKLPYYKIELQMGYNPTPFYSGEQIPIPKYWEEQIPKYCILTRAFISTLDRIGRLEVEHQANIEICRTGLALKIFKAGNGTYPETLFFLSERPIDPFSGKELIYKKSGNGFILYSLGPNMKDDGGTPRVSDYKDPNYENYDIVWKCEK